MRRLVTHAVAVVAVLSISGCSEDPVAAPSDVRGVYDLTSVAGRTTFPIYLGMITYPAGDGRPGTGANGQPGKVETWLVGGELRLHSTEYRFLPRIRLRWENTLYAASYNGDVTQTLNRCGDWNYFAPEVAFAPVTQQGIDYIGVAGADGAATTSGILVEEAKVFLDPNADIPVSANAVSVGFYSTKLQPVDVVFTKSDRPLPVESTACSQV